VASKPCTRCTHSLYKRSRRSAKWFIILRCSHPYLPSSKCPSRQLSTSQSSSPKARVSEALVRKLFDQFELVSISNNNNNNKTTTTYNYKCCGKLKVCAGATHTKHRGCSCVCVCVCAVIQLST